MPTVLITGANRGLGRALAETYCAAGWNVIATCRNAADQPALQKACPTADVYQLDLASEKSIDELASLLNDRAIDVLLNNAVWAVKEGGLMDVTYDNWAHSMKVNAFSVLQLARSFLSNLLLSERKAIVHISSSMGSISANDLGGKYSYRSSKAAAHMIIRNLAIDLADQNIIAVSIHPGWLQTRLGGPDAEISPAIGAARIKVLLDRLTPAQSGKFLTATGEELNW